MMFDDKQIREAQDRIKQHIQNKTITTKGKTENVNFFLKNARNSLNSARVLFDTSSNN
jgi:translation initiation factor 2B subunit (eIF-2B alpha/beta/delta family)